MIKTYCYLTFNYYWVCVFGAWFMYVIMDCLFTLFHLSPINNGIFSTVLPTHSLCFFFTRGVIANICFHRSSTQPFHFQLQYSVLQYQHFMIGKCNTLYYLPSSIHMNSQRSMMGQCCCDLQREKIKAIPFIQRAQ